MYKLIDARKREYVYLENLNMKMFEIRDAWVLLSTGTRCTCVYDGWVVMLPSCGVEDPFREGFRVWASESATACSSHGVGDRDKHSRKTYLVMCDHRVMATLTLVLYRRPSATLGESTVFEWNLCEDCVGESVSRVMMTIEWYLRNVA